MIILNHVILVFLFRISMDRPLLCKLITAKTYRSFFKDTRAYLELTQASNLEFFCEYS